MADSKIRVATTDPRLKDKVSVNLSGNVEKVYWYIKFNIALDDTTVTPQNMSVTDTEGYIMRTDMQYDTDKNRIVVSPLESYIEGIFYLLNISKRVKSARGNPMKREIHILFKLQNGQISEFELLKSTVKAPKPVARPKNYDTMMAKKYSFANIEEKISKESLDFKEMNINILLCILGIIMMFASFYLSNTNFILAATAICIIGVIHVFIQASKATFRAAVQYNLGAMHFNNGKYEKAIKKFDKAARIAPHDEDIEYAQTKVKFYR